MRRRMCRPLIFYQMGTSITIFTIFTLICNHHITIFNHHIHQYSTYIPWFWSHHINPCSLCHGHPSLWMTVDGCGRLGMTGKGSGIHIYICIYMYIRFQKSMTANVTIVRPFLFPWMWRDANFYQGTWAWHRSVDFRPDLLTRLILMPELVMIYNLGLSKMGQMAKNSPHCTLGEGCSALEDRCKHTYVFSFSCEWMNEWMNHVFSQCITFCRTAMMRIPAVRIMSYPWNHSYWYIMIDLGHLFSPGPNGYPLSWASEHAKSHLLLVSYLRLRRDSAMWTTADGDVGEVLTGEAIQFLGEFNHTRWGLGILQRFNHHIWKIYYEKQDL